MATFIPGQHRYVIGQVLTFDVGTQTGTVQFIGLYGRDKTSKVTPTQVGTAPNWTTNNKLMADTYTVKTSYNSGDWVGIVGIMALSGTDPVNPRSGIQYVGPAVNYYIIGELKHKRPDYLLDHGVKP